MKILIDGIIYSLQGTGGVSVYFSELIRFLVRQRKLLTDVRLYQPCIGQGIEDICTASFAHLQRSRWQERYRRCVQAVDADVFHSSYYRRPANSGVPTVVTVHDFYYERFRHGLPRWGHTWQKFAAIKAAQAIICVSQATADDLLRFVGVRKGQALHVIPNGVGEAFGLRPSTRLDPRQLLFVGGRGGYKNFALVLQALQWLPEHKLVCVGGGALRAEELAGVPASVGARVKHMAFVSDTILADLYRQSLALVYPSSFEGFGIPVAEAMKCGCPVVGLQECVAVCEIGGDALLGVAEADPALLARAIESLQEPVVRARHVARGVEQAAPLSWQVTHEQTLKVYESLQMQRSRK